MMITEHHNYDQAVSPSVNNAGLYDSLVTWVGTKFNTAHIACSFSVILSDHRPKMWRIKLSAYNAMLMH